MSIKKPNFDDSAVRKINETRRAFEEEISCKKINEKNSYLSMLFDNFSKLLNCQSVETIKIYVNQKMESSNVCEHKFIKKMRGDIALEDQFLIWFLWRMSNSNFEEADKNLDNYLSSQVFEERFSSWIFGVKLESSLTIKDGIELCPINEMPNSNEKYFYSKLKQNDTESPYMIIDDYQGITVVPYVLQYPEVAIVKKYVTNKAVESSASMHEFHENANDIILLCNLLEDIVCTAGPFKNYIDDHVPFGPLSHTGSSFGIDKYIAPYKTKMEPYHAKKLTKLYDQFSRHDEKVRIRNSIKHFRQSKRSTGGISYLDLCIAVEMLLLSSSTKDQLRFQFALRGAWLLGEDYKSREELFKNLGILYNLGSEIRHNGALTTKKNIKGDSQGEFRHFTNLAKNLIISFISKSNINWTEIILK